MEHNQSSFTPDSASDDSVSPLHSESDEDRLYWRGVADGLARAGASVPSDIAARAGPPGDPADALAFDPVPLRYREDGLTPEKQRAYVEALADTGVAREAAARIEVTEQAINRVRRRADARSFDLACEAAHRFGARNVLRSAAFERAILGTIRRHYYHGELKSEERVHDTRMLIYLIGKAGHLLDPPEEAKAVCDNWQPYMDALEHGLPAPDLAHAEAAGSDEDLGDEQVWLEKDVWWTLFPPPDGFDGEERGALGDPDYERTLTSEEAAALRARRQAASDGELTHCCAMRDRFFGLPPRGAPGFSYTRQAETYETSAAFPLATAPGEGRGPVEQRPESDHTQPDQNSEGGSG